MTTAAPDLGLFVDVNMDLEPACEVDNCGNTAQLILRSACGCPILCCNQCRNEDKADIQLWEARQTLNGHIGVEWECPVCQNSNIAHFPNAYAQIVISVIPL